MNIERRTRLFDAVERTAEAPMLVLSLLLIPLLGVPLITTVPRSIAPVWLAVNWIVWAAFAVELVVKTYLAPDRRRYVIRHWFDVLIVAVPLLRPLRLAGSARIIRLARLARLAAVGANATAAVRAVLSRHGLQYVLLLSIALVFAAAAVATHFERDAGGSINDFGTALWWTTTTVTTVGYGDTYPVTPAGRGLGVFVMLVGITVFGLVTANIAAFFVESHNDQQKVTLKEVLDHIQSLERQMLELRAELGHGARADGSSAAPAPTEPRSRLT